MMHKEYLSNVSMSVLLKVAITSVKLMVDFCLSVQKFLTSGSTDVRFAALPLMAFSSVGKELGFSLVHVT